MEAYCIFHNLMRNRSPAMQNTIVDHEKRCGEYILRHGDTDWIWRTLSLCKALRLRHVIGRGNETCSSAPRMVQLFSRNSELAGKNSGNQLNSINNVIVHWDACSIIVFYV